MSKKAFAFARNYFAQTIHQLEDESRNMEKFELLDKAQAAEMLRIRPVTLDRMTKAGTGPAPTRVGGKVFFQPIHIHSWIEAKHKPAAK